MTMNYETLMNKYPMIRVATEADNEKLLSFFREAEMDMDQLSLRFDRSPDFFSLLNQQSEKPFVAIFENQDGSIGGTAAFCLRTNYLEGKPVSAAYLSDLRLSPKLSRETRLLWRDFYTEILEHAHLFPKLNHCQFLYSVVLDENKKAVLALTRNKGKIIYRELARYQTVTLLYRFPFWWKRLTSPDLRAGRLKIRRASHFDYQKLRRFLAKEHQKKVFGQYFIEDPSTDPIKTDEFDRRLKVWEHFKVSSFWLVEDREGQIVSCVCPWTMNKSRRLIIGKMPPHLKFLGKILPFFGKKAIRSENELKILYLTHLEFSSVLSLKQKTEIFSELLKSLYSSKETKDYHFVSFFDFNDQSLMPAITKSGYFYQLTPATLYQVHHKNHDTSEKLVDTTKMGLPGIDIGTA